MPFNIELAIAKADDFYEALIDTNPAAGQPHRQPGCPAGCAEAVP
jgi:hypothetical protein